MPTMGGCAKSFFVPNLTLAILGWAMAELGFWKLALILLRTHLIKIVTAPTLNLTQPQLQLNLNSPNSILIHKSSN